MRCASTHKLLTGLWAIGALLYGSLALAHAQFSSSDPADGATLESAPHEIVLTFSQAVTPVTVSLVGPDGSSVESASKPSADGERVILPLSGTLQPGSYVVSYRVLSGDAHAIIGDFRFQLAALVEAEREPGGEAVVDFPIPSVVVEPATNTAPGIGDSTLSVQLLEQTVRVIFIGLLLLTVGSVIFWQVVPVPDELATWIQSLARTTATAGLLVTVTYFIVAALNIAGPGAFEPRLFYIVLQSSIGMSLMLALLGFLFLATPGGAQRIWTGIAATILVASRIVTGHPASQEPIALLIPSMAIHVAAAGFWFASLVVLLRLLRNGPLATAPDILSAFARAAVWSVGALLVVGLAMAVVHLNSVEALFLTDYGAALLWKLAGVVGLLFLALINKYVLTPRFNTSIYPRALKTSIRIEAALMIVVIVLSTFLAATPPAAEAGEPPTVRSIDPGSDFDLERFVWNRGGRLEQ